MLPHGFLPSPARTLLGVTLAILSLSGCVPEEAVEQPADRAAPPIENVGLQLYTIRELLAGDVPGTLAQVAEIGYGEVETAGFHGLTPTQFRSELERVGLQSPAGHYPIEQMRTDLDEVLETATVLGQYWIVVPSLPEDDRNAEGYRRVADELNTFATAARQRGLRLAYHNHAFEFEPLEGAPIEGPRNGYEILLARTDPDLVEFELDVFWAVRGGADPLELFERHPGRFPLLHIKDMADPDGEMRMVDVGSGELDFRRILGAWELAGLLHYFVEHDNPDDPIASIRAGYQHLRSLTFE